jgi:hypothetical protein
LNCQQEEQVAGYIDCSGRLFRTTCGICLPQPKLLC